MHNIEHEEAHLIKDLNKYRKLKYEVSEYERSIQNPHQYTKEQFYIFCPSKNELIERKSNPAFVLQQKLTIEIRSSTF